MHRLRQLPPIHLAHLGILLVGLPIPLLLIPARTPIGGAPGLAALLYFLTDLPPGALAFALNAGFLLLARVLLGPKGFFPSLYSSILLSAVIEVVFRWVPIAEVTAGMWPWVMQASAAMIIGVGLACLVASHYTPAGTAVLSVILHRVTRIPVIAWLITLDCSIAIASGLCMAPMTGLRAAFGIAVMYPTYHFVEKQLREPQPVEEACLPLAANQ